MDLFKRIQDLSSLYDDDGPSATVQESRPMFDKGGMAKLVSYVEGLPKGSTVTAQILQDYADKNNLDVNLKNFFNRNAKTIKNKTFISDTRSKDLKLTSEEKANIEKYGQEKYDRLTDKSDKLRVRKGQDVGSLALDKQQKVKFKKEYDKAIKYYKNKGIEPNMDSIRKNIASNNGKFNATGTKLQSESGLTGLFKNYEKADLIADLKKGKNLSEISIEYLDKNEKQVLKMLEGKRDYSKPLGRLSTDLSNIISGDEEATKLYDKIKKTNSFNKLKNKSTYKKAVETLIPFAQEQGLIPNVNLKGKKINTASDYFNYAYKVKRDPVAKLFGFYERVGIEHPGGVARALIFDDPATLNEIVATMPDTNLVAGSTYDTYATGQARFFEKTKDPKYIKKINQIILNKQKEYGKPRTILDVDGDNVTRRATKFSLTNPNLIEDSKSFINEYVAAGGSQRKNFNKLDPSLQQSILAFEEGDKIKGNKFLKTALKETGAEADFNKTLNTIEKNLLKLSGQIDPDCKQASADGGRIGLKTIGSPNVCITKARNYMSEELTKGIGTQQNAKTSLIKRILTGSANFLKQSLSPKELFKMENLIGKPALYGAAAFETALVADDVLRKGKPLNVAAAESLFGSVLNLDANAARAKNLLESNTQLSPAAKEYAQNILDYDKYRKLDLSFPSSLVAKSMPGSEKYFKMQEDLKKKIESTPDTGAFDYQSALDESEGSFKAKPKVLDAPDAPDVTPLTNKFAQPPGRRVGPMTAKKDMKIDLTPLTYQNFKPDYGFTKEQFEDAMRKEGALADDQVYQDAFYKREVEKPIEFKQLMELPSFRGASEKFAGGGIAKMAGDRSGAMTRSMNPDSQGLSYLFNRVKKV